MSLEAESDRTLECSKFGQTMGGQYIAALKPDDVSTKEMGYILEFI